MKRYYKINADKTYGGDMIRAEYHPELDPMPENVTDVRPADGLYRGEWTEVEWVESAPVPEYDAETETAVWDYESKTWSVQPKPEPEPSNEQKIERLMDEIAQVKSQNIDIYIKLVDAGTVMIDDVPETIKDTVLGEVREASKNSESELKKP